MSIISCEYKNNIKSPTKLLLHVRSHINNAKTFDNEEIQAIIYQLCNIDYFPPKAFIEIVYSLVPSVCVLDESIDLLFARVLRYYRFGERVDRNHLLAILHWIRAMIIFDIISVDSLKHHYLYYLELLQYEPFRKVALHLIYLTTDYSNLRESIVYRIIEYEKLHGRQPETKALLSHFRKLKPHLVASTTEFLNNEAKYFCKLPRKLYSNIMVMRMCMTPQVKLEFKNNGVYVNANILIRQFAQYNLQSYVNDVQTLQKKSVITKSVIQSEYGFLLIALCSNAVQEGIAKDIQHYLEEGFVFTKHGKNQKISNEFKNLLISLHQMQIYYNEEIEPVSNFIYENLNICNMQVISEEIINLIGYLVIRQFDNYYSSVVKILHNVCVSNKNNWEFFLYVLDALSELIYNNYLFLKNENTIFLAKNKRVAAEGDIRQVREVINELCLLFLNIHHENEFFVSEVLNNYLKIAKSERTINAFDIVVIPHSIVNKVLVGTNPCAIETLSRVLLKSLETISILKLRLNTTDNLNCELIAQLDDVYELFMGDPERVSALSILKYEKHFEAMSGYENHLAFQVFYYFDVDGNLCEPLEESERTVKFVEEMPQLYELLKILNTIRAE